MSYRLGRIATRFAGVAAGLAMSAIGAILFADSASAASTLKIEAQSVGTTLGWAELRHVVDLLK
jgi:hypothetical protein